MLADEGQSGSPNITAVNYNYIWPCRSRRLWKSKLMESGSREDMMLLLLEGGQLPPDRAGRGSLCARPQVFNSLLTLMFAEPEWAELENMADMSLEDMWLAAFDFCAVAHLLDRLHLFGEFALNNVIRFYDRLAAPDLRASAEVRNQHSRRLARPRDAAWNQMLHEHQHAATHRFGDMHVSKSKS